MFIFIKKYFSDTIALPLFEKKNIKKGIKINLNSFGNFNKNKTFYVIKRSPGAGLFSNVIYVLNHLKIAIKHNFIPFVDMQNFFTIYNENNKINKTFNAWEYYFHQVSSYSIDEIYKSKKVIITNNTFYKNFSHSISNNNYRKIASKFFKVKKKFTIFADKFVKKNFKKNTLGVHYRGTSYKTSANHPFPATNQQVLKYCKFLMKKYDYEEIFLCTEDQYIFEELNKKFKGKICFLKNSYRSYHDDAFKKYKRKNHRYKLGKEILVEALILSKCQGFLHAKTNVSEFVKFLEKKKTIKYFYLNNGINSSNEFIAKWLWYYKNIFPSFLGGFK